MGQQDAPDGAAGEGLKGYWRMKWIAMGAGYKVKRGLLHWRRPGGG